MANLAVERVLRVFAYYLIPIGIGLFSLIALLFWHNQYSVTEPAALPLRVLQQPLDAGPDPAPAAILARMGSQRWTLTPRGRDRVERLVARLGHHEDEA